MTFSEDDLLPYKRLERIHTAEHLKTIFMQWTILDAALQEHLQEIDGFVTGITPNKLSQMSVLDMSDLVSDFCYHPQDFAATFEQVVNGADPESLERAARRQELGTVLYALFKAETPQLRKLSTDVEKLIDDELKSTSISEAVWMKATVRSKVAMLAGFRLREKISQRRLSSYHNSDFEFTVYLNRLVGGSEHRTWIKLYFTFATSFHEFERALQEQTMLCIIPPDENHSLNPSDPTQSLPIPSSASSSIDSPTYTAHKTTWVKASLPPTRTEKGYTVKDGPWRCNIGSPKGYYKQKTYYVSDETSYRNLILKLQVFNKEDPDSEHQIVIMHSKERAIWDKFQEQKKTDRQDYIQRCRRSEGDVGDEDGDDDNSGETYMEWLWRTQHAQQK